MSDHDEGNAPPGEPGEHRDDVPGEKTPGGKLVQFSSGLSKPFIQRPVMTMLLTASLIVFGILTFKLLAVNDLPAVDYPVISVSASYPGANPETMANTIATPLEKQFTQIPGLTLSTSSSTQGSTNITLQFDLDKSIIDASTDVQAAIQRASGQLPSDLPQPPQFQKSNPNDQPVMYIALTSDTLSDGDLYKYATSQVQQRINILPACRRSRSTGSKAPFGSRSIHRRSPRATSPSTNFPPRSGPGPPIPAPVSLTGKTLRWSCARTDRLAMPRAIEISLSRGPRMVRRSSCATWRMSWTASRTKDFRGISTRADTTRRLR
jgi:Cation/multidrug efflux pump